MRARIKVLNIMLKQNRSNTVAFNTSSTESLALPSPTSTGNFMNSTTYNITNSFTNATDSDDDGDYDCGDDGWVSHFGPRNLTLIDSGLTIRP